MFASDAGGVKVLLAKMIVEVGACGGDQEFVKKSKRVAQLRALAAIIALAAGCAWDRQFYEIARRCIL